MSYFNQDCKPITHDEWLDIYAKTDERRLGKTQIGRFYISTVWLGLNYRYNPGPPLIFETMIFDSQKDDSDIGCQRYSTKLEALTGHIDAIEWVQKTNGEGYWPE